MIIGPYKIGGDAPCFVIAEIGINHNGHLRTALDMIAAAHVAGANAVKFQKRTVDIVYTEEELARPRESIYGKTNGDLKRGLEFDIGAYVEIDWFCRSIGMLWFASPWDVPSVQFLEPFDMPAWKIASACATDHALVHAVRDAAVPSIAGASDAAPILISTGALSPTQITDALFAAQIGMHHRVKPNPVALLACTASYPAAPEDLNLRRLVTMQAEYPAFPIGWSGHEVGVFTSVAAVALGAKIVERHFTLDRTMWGSDQAASLEPKGFAKMVEEIRTLERAMGSGEIRMLDCEHEVMRKLRRVA